jgi:Domain of Unknown Function (DUF1080)
MNSLCVVLMIAGIAGDKDARRWDFEDATVGKLPPGWSATQTGKGKGGVWKVLEDKTAPKGPKVLAQTASEQPKAFFNLCIADKSRFTDLDLTVSFKPVAGKTDQGGGPVWRYQDADNYYVARMNPLEDNFRVYKVVAGKRMQLGTVEDIVAAVGKWHTIRVVHKGNHIQCYFNGKLHLDVKDDTFKEAGKIGLWTKADAQTYFDDLVIRKAE